MPTQHQSNAVVTQVVTDEVEEYTTSVAGVELENFRTGPGVGQSLVLGTQGARFTFTRSTIGFPMLSRTTVPDDVFVMAYVPSSPPGTRWCEIDLEPGAILAYAPAAEHTANALPGLDWMVAIIASDQLLESADRLGMRVDPPSRGEVRLLAPTAKTDLIGDAFRAFAAAAGSGTYPPSALDDDVLRAAIRGLSEEGRPRRVGRAKRINSRRVVHACADYAQSIRRIPSIGELCAAAYVSERKLRAAFLDEFDLPPSQFFRAWALDEAHRRLARAESDEETVTRVATDLGFRHLGRFAANYRVIYAELPSLTLRRTG